MLQSPAPYALLTLFVLTTTPVICTGAGAAEDFAGTWEASHKGRVFFCVTIRPGAEAVSGTAIIGYVHADGNGVILEASEEPKTISAIRNVTISGRTLRFRALDGEDLETFEMTLGSRKDTAGLRADGMPVAFRPFALRRVAGRR